MDFNEIPRHILRAEPMMAGELKRKLRNVPNDTPVYMVVDKISEDAWDEDKEQWRYVLPLVHVTRERIYGDENGGDESNLLLEYENL